MSVIHYGKKDGFEYYYLGYYYSPNIYSDKDLADFEAKTRRDLVNFKNGKSTKDQLNQLTHFIIDVFSPENTLLCIIPASNTEKTEKRYKTFIEHLSAAANIKNGYETICNNIDWENDILKHEKSNYIDSFSFKSEKIIGKNIILFHDLITTGNSFKIVAEKLMTLGANSVIGLFICKTSYKKIGNLL